MTIGNLKKLPKVIWLSWNKIKDPQQQNLKQTSRHMEIEQPVVEWWMSHWWNQKENEKVPILNENEDNITKLSGTMKAVPRGTFRNKDIHLK